MVDIAPFRGLRFDPGTVGSLAHVTAPPYDAIGPEDQARLHDASPYNIVRLELGRDLPEDEPGRDRYSRAASLYRRWCEAGVLELDRSPGFDVYEQHFDHRGRRHVQIGLLVALAVAPWASGDVLPHERVFRGPVEDRKRLLAALPANLSPVFALAPRTPAPVAELMDRVRAAAPTAAFDDGDGVSHRLWRLTDPEAIATVTAAFRDRSVLMADGHHRYTTALEHHAERPGPGTDRVLTYLVGADHGPVIDASHRLVRRLSDETLNRLRRLGFRLTPTEVAAPELARQLETAPPRTFGLVTAGGSWELHGDRAHLDALVSDVPAPVDDLDITVLQRVLLGPLEVPDRMEELRYTSDVAAAARSIDEGACDGLFLVRPVSFAQFRAASEAGVRMPPKSTTFVPKPRTGLVLRPLDPTDGPCDGPDRAGQ